jgi:hypothetical protein
MALKRWLLAASLPCLLLHAVTATPIDDEQKVLAQPVREYTQESTQTPLTGTDVGVGAGDAAGAEASGQASGEDSPAAVKKQKLHGRFLHITGT